MRFPALKTNIFMTHISYLSRLNVSMKDKVLHIQLILPLHTYPIWILLYISVKLGHCFR